MSRRPPLTIRAKARADERPSPRLLILAAAAFVAAAILMPMMAHAAGDYGGSSSSGSSSGGSGYAVDAISKEMRKAQTLINKQDYAGALTFLEAHVHNTPI